LKTLQIKTVKRETREQMIERIRREAKGERINHSYQKALGIGRPTRETNDPRDTKLGPTPRIRCAIRLHGPCTVAKIIEVTAVDKTRCYGIINRLKRLGIVAHRNGKYSLAKTEVCRSEKRKV